MLAEKGPSSPRGQHFVVMPVGLHIQSEGQHVHLVAFIVLSIFYISRC